MLENGNAASAHPTCLYAAQAIDPSFTAPSGSVGGGGSGFWSNPTNIVELLGAAGGATGSWLNAFGIGNQAPAYTPPPPTTEKKGIPGWVWGLILLFVIALIIFLIVQFS